jgi:hypothetical protein
MPTITEQRQRARTILAGGLLGLLVAGTLALPSVLPPALADEEPFRTMLKTGEELLPDAPLPEFVKPDWTIEPWVSTDVQSRQIVRKIGYGRTEFVDIVTTSTGTYSSDGLASPHIRYPGIHGTHLTADGRATLLGLWNGSGWTILKGLDADSFVTIVPFDGGATFVHEDGACVFVKGGSVYC